MRQRCNRPNHPAYKNYGGRGISVCPEWSSFQTFLEDVGERPGPEFSLDRIDNDGDYEPGNVRWATRSTQALNRRKPPNATGVLGVYLLPNGKFRARITLDGEFTHLGCFDTIEEASEAIRIARLKHANEETQ